MSCLGKQQAKCAFVKACGWLGSVQCNSAVRDHASTGMTSQVLLSLLAIERHVPLEARHVVNEDTLLGGHE